MTQALNLSCFISLSKESKNASNYTAINLQQKILSMKLNMKSKKRKGLSEAGQRQDKKRAQMLKNSNILLNQDFQNFPIKQLNISSKTSDRDSNRKENNSYYIYQQLNALGLSNFNLQFVIGKGGFGKVWKVVEKITKKTYAMKQMKKSKIILKESVQSVMNERDLLVVLRHPFLVNIYRSFQDWQYLYLVTDYCNRGDLRYHLTMREIFTEEESCFFLACALVCLQHLHSKGVIHRDLKPQNMVLDSKGYVKITDLGVSRRITLQNFTDTSGTPSYMAPEVLFRTNHSFGVDFYALGVIAFEFMTGKRPYLGRNRKQIKNKIFAYQAQINIQQAEGWSSRAVDFVNRMIQRKPEARLGFKGIEEVKNHPFFMSINWQLLEQKKLLSPFIPNTIEQDYESYKRGIPEDTRTNEIQEQRLMYDLQGNMQAFKGYEWDSQRQRMYERTLKSQIRKKTKSKN